METYWIWTSRSLASFDVLKSIWNPIWMTIELVIKPLKFLWDLIILASILYNVSRQHDYQWPSKMIKNAFHPIDWRRSPPRSRIAQPNCSDLVRLGVRPRVLDFLVRRQRKANLGTRPRPRYVGRSAYRHYNNVALSEQIPKHQISIFTIDLDWFGTHFEILCWHSVFVYIHYWLEHKFQLLDSDLLSTNIANRNKKIPIVTAAVVRALQSWFKKWPNGADVLREHLRCPTVAADRCVHGEPTSGLGVPGHKNFVRRLTVVII